MREETVLDRWMCAMSFIVFETVRFVFLTLFVFKRRDKGLCKLVP